MILTFAKIRITLPGSTRIDRAYSWGNLVVVEAKYEGFAFSDHMALIVKVKVPDDFSKLLSPETESKILFLERNLGL